MPAMSGRMRSCPTSTLPETPVNVRSPWYHPKPSVGPGAKLSTSHVARDPCQCEIALVPSEAKRRAEPGRGRETEVDAARQAYADLVVKREDASDQAPGSDGLDHIR